MENTPRVSGSAASYTDVPPTTNISLLQLRLQAAQVMRGVQADRILRLHTQADQMLKEAQIEANEAAKYNLDKSLEDLAKLAATEEGALQEAFPPITQGQDELFKLKTISKEEEEPDSKPKASTTKKRRAVSAKMVKPAAKKSKAALAAKPAAKKSKGATTES